MKPHTPPIANEPYAWLLDPLSPSTFEDEFYERRHRGVHRQQPNYFESLLTFADLDHVLGTHALRFPDISLVRADETAIDASRFTGPAGVAEPLEVTRLFDEGATVIFRGLHRRLPQLAALCVALGQRFGSRIQTNIYLTPPESQGFKPHWDTHDVFVMQVSGSKRWSVFESPIALPLRGQKCNPDVDRPGRTIDEFDLHAGDFVYLPRGLMHAARSVDTASLHITLGLTAFTWADVLADAVSAAALENPALRANLPVGFASGKLTPEETATLARQHLDLALDRSFEDVWRRFASEVSAANQPLFSDLLTQRADQHLVNEDTVVIRREMAIHSYLSQHECVMCFAGQELRFPLHVAEAIEFICANDRFTALELPGPLDTAGNLTLIRRLAREGLLRSHHERSRLK